MTILNLLIEMEDRKMKEMNEWMNEWMEGRKEERKGNTEREVVAEMSIVCL